jgi:hypothetical protein
MSVNWEAVRALAWHIYQKAAQTYLFLSLFLYLLACVVAHQPVGPGNYVNFVDHAFKWEVYGKQISTAKVDAREH